LKPGGIVHKPGVEVNHMSNLSHQHFYSSMVSPGDLCFDIGANIGARTASLLALGAVVVAVEPQPKLAQSLKQQFWGSIAAGNLFVLDKGLDKEPGECTLMFTDDNSMCSMSETFVNSYTQYNLNFHAEAPQKVEVTTLDALIETYGVPKLCKVDVEGFDYKVLQGLSYPIEHVSFEFNMIPTLVDVSVGCVDHLTMLGDYEFNFLIMNNLHFELPNWVSADVMRYIIINELAHTHTDLLIQQRLYGDVFARCTKRVKRQAPVAIPVS
jgi:FkbM family methyltransferase